MNDLSGYEDVYIEKIDYKGAFIGSLPGDTPLLDELGINFDTIKQESKVIVEVFTKKSITFNCKTADCAGPLLFYLMYSIFLMGNGKVHFGYIYFLSLISNLFIYFLLNVLGEKSINIFETFSGLGYSQLPVTIFSLTNLVFKYFSVHVRLVIGTLFAIWSSVTGTSIFVKFLELDKLYIIIGYPLFLIYFCYSSLCFKFLIGSLMSKCLIFLFISSFIFNK
ncbi:Rab GTPase-interacting Golgi membrane protein [Tubulinosema ratisbonensis]|uniref:Rab GTPase-interacting Golgi membrane protein n=1 Tax=Tubulinosema ratisbonensis TaxID=291195 RepID=A0A437AHJ2_9MICR|nr:Rab GTPase-interacting Golgi membrane protein [Tubulinosema ratisbonensis]